MDIPSHGKIWVQKKNSVRGHERSYQEDEMKSLLGKLGVILIGFAIFGYAEVWGEDWKLYEDNEFFSSYYDAQSITHPSKNIFRVWVKVSLKEAIKERIAFGEKYISVQYYITLIEYDCVERKRKFLTMTYYDKNAIPVESVNFEKRGYDFFGPEMPDEKLCEVVCK